jgi:nucleoprotein TPR
VTLLRRWLSNWKACLGGELPVPGCGPLAKAWSLRFCERGNGGVESDGGNGKQGGGKTFTEVYADYVHLHDEFVKQSVEYEKMERTLSTVLGEIQDRVRPFAIFLVFPLNLPP